MPFYNFVCEDCGDTKELRMSMHEEHAWHCSKCDKFMVRDFRAEGLTQTHSGREYTKPIISDSMAIHADQVAEHRRRWPNIPLTDEHQPVFTNYGDHQKYLDDVGMVKVPQKVRHVFAKKAAVKKTPTLKGE